jgi:hypothetical protein
VLLTQMSKPDPTNHERQARFRARWLISTEDWAAFLEAFTAAAEEGQKSPLTRKLPEYPGECIRELTGRLRGSRLVFCRSRRGKGQDPS